MIHMERISNTRVLLSLLIVIGLLFYEGYGFHRPSSTAGLLQRSRWSTIQKRHKTLFSTTQEDNDISNPLSAQSATKGFGPPRAKTGTVNKRLMNVIDAELKVVQENKAPEPSTLSEEDTDLNGINPIQPLGSAAFAGLVSFLFWRITIGLASALNNVHLDTEFYPAKRIFSIASTAFVGITALGAGVIGVTAIGLLGLALRVSLGIATGELDPNKKRVVDEGIKGSIPVDAQGLPKITGAWYDVKPPPLKEDEESDK